MARRSLKPQLNQIRTWVHQGRTNAWIAHQLEVSVRDIDAFKREHELVPAEQHEDPPEDPFGARVEEEPDLRAEDDALVAAELDAEPEEEIEAESAEGEEKPKRRRGRRGGGGGGAGGGRAGGRPPAGRGPRGAQAARGHVRPRGRGLWPVARPRRAGRPRLRRALGRP